MLPPAKQIIPHTHTFSHMVCPTARMQLLTSAIVSSCSSRLVMATWPNLTRLRHLHPAWDAPSLSMSCSSGRRSRDRHPSVQRCQQGAQGGRSEVPAFGAFSQPLEFIDLSIADLFQINILDICDTDKTNIFLIFIFFKNICPLDQAAAPRHGTKVTG